MMKISILMWIIAEMIGKSSSETFLEKQKRIAQEQWKYEQEQQLKKQTTVSNDGESAEYYYYYEGSESQYNNQQEYEYEEEVPSPPKKHGYQKATVTYSKKVDPLSVALLVKEYQEQLNCLTKKEIDAELNRVVSISVNILKPRRQEKH